MKTKHFTFDGCRTWGWFDILPVLSIQHKYWYLWTINCGWLWFDFCIDICRRDWKHKGDFDDSHDDEM